MVVALQVQDAKAASGASALWARNSCAGRPASFLMARTRKPALRHARIVARYATASPVLARNCARSSCVGRQPNEPMRGAARLATACRNSGAIERGIFAAVSWLLLLVFVRRDAAQSETPQCDFEKCA